MTEREEHQNKELEKSVSDIVSDYKELISATQTELTKLKEELYKTKKDIEVTLETNENTAKVPTDLNLNDDIIVNFNQQIHFLKQERDTLNSLWKVSQQTISRLEEEIKSYRNQLGFQPKTLETIKGKYENALNCLQGSVKTQKQELVKQLKINRDMVAEGHKAQNHIKELKAKLQEMEPNQDDARRESEALKVRNADLERMLKKANRMIEERMLSEQEALEKVQEALLLSEMAVNEKNLALSREQVCKDECKNFASIIGEVMDDAAKKVEDNYKDLQSKYKCQIDKLHKENKQLKKELEESRSSTRKAEMNCSKIGSKCADIMKVNAMLETNLELSSKAIVELEIKIKAYDKLIQRDMRSEELALQREKEMEKYVSENHNLKDKWKGAIEDFTKTFEEEICKLRDSNTSLENENRELRTKLSAE